jgi:hypothetical protein
MGDSANGGRQPIGALPLQAISLPSAGFTEGEIANPSGKCPGMRKTGGAYDRRSPLAHGRA